MTNFDRFNFENWRTAVDTMEVEQEEHVKVEAIKAAAKKSKLPILSSTEKIYTWVLLMKNFAMVNIDDDLEGSHDQWCILAQSALDLTSKDQMMLELHDAIIEHGLPGDTKVRVVVPARDLSNAKELAKRTTEAWYAERTTEPALGPAKVEIYRPLAVWEWLQDFVELVWISLARKASYKRALKELRYIELPRAQGYFANQSNMVRHFTKIKDYVALSQIKDEQEQVEALKLTFVDDKEYYKKVVNVTTWNEAVKELKGEAEARYLCTQVEVMAVPAIAVAVEAVQQETRVEEARDIGRSRRDHHRSSSRNNRREYRVERRSDFRRDRRGGSAAHRPYGERSDTRNRRSPPRRSAPAYARNDQREVRVCYHCGGEGHAQRVCRARLEGRPSRFPPRKEGLSWNEHVKDVINRRALL
jgi:hypothetical protein